MGGTTCLDRNNTKKTVNDDYVLLIGHHQLYSSENTNPNNGGYTELQAHIEPLLSKYRVDAYICGHVHRLQHLNKNNIEYIISGAGAKVIVEGLVARDSYPRNYLVFDALTPGYVAVTVDSQNMNFTFLDYNNTNLYEFLLPNPKKDSILDGWGLPVILLGVLFLLLSAALILYVRWYNRGHLSDNLGSGYKSYEADQELQIQQ